MAYVGRDAPGDWTLAGYTGGPAPRVHGAHNDPAPKVQDEREYSRGRPLQAVGFNGYDRSGLLDWLGKAGARRGSDTGALALTIGWGATALLVALAAFRVGMAL